MVFADLTTKFERTYCGLSFSTVLLSSCSSDYNSFAETMSKRFVVWEVTWQNVHHKQSVLQVQGHTVVGVGGCPPPPPRPLPPPPSLSVHTCLSVSLSVTYLRHFVGFLSSSSSVSSDLTTFLSAFFFLSSASSLSSDPTTFLSSFFISFCLSFFRSADFSSFFLFSTSSSVSSDLPTFFLSFFLSFFLHRLLFLQL